MGDALAVGAILTLVYGWAAVWPISRWALHLRGKRYRVLGWIFAVAVVLSTVAHLYAWYAFASANRDAWMASIFAQLVGWGAWIATAIAAVVLWSNHETAG